MCDRGAAGPSLDDALRGSNQTSLAHSEQATLANLKKYNRKEMLNPIVVVEPSKNSAVVTFNVARSNGCGALSDRVCGILLSNLLGRR